MADQVLADTSKILVVDPDGRTVEIPNTPEARAQASRDGMHSANVGQVREQRLEGEYGGLKGQAIAAGSGAASMATMGGSDLVAAGVPEWKEAVSESRQRNPLSTMAGEAAAVVGGLGATRALGDIAAKTVGKALPRALEKSVAGRVASTVAKGAAESLPYTAQSIVSESALGDPQHTAENLWSKVGTNALLFGGIGGAGKLLSEGVKPLAAGMTSAVEKARDTFTKHFPEMSSAVTGKSVAESADILARRGAEAPAEPLVRDVLQGPAAPDGAFAPDKGEYIREATGAINDVRAKAKQVVNEMGELHRAGKEELLQYVPLSQAENHAAEQLGSLNDAVNGLRGASDQFAKPIVDQIESKVNAYAAKVSEAQTPHALHEAADQLRGQLWDVAGINAMSTPSPQLQDVLQRAKKMASGVAKGLEDTAVWGEAGANQAAFNRVYSGVKSADRDLMRAMGEKVGRTLEASPRKIATWLKSGEGAENDIRQRVFKQWLDAHHEMATVGDDLAGRVGRHAGDFDRDGLRALLERSQKAANDVVGYSRENYAFEQAQKAGMADARAQAAMDAKFEAALNKQASGEVISGAAGHSDLLGASGLAAGLGALGHHGLAGMFGGAYGLYKAGKGVHALLSKPEMAALRLGQLEGLARKAQALVDSHIDRVVGGVASAGRGVGRAAGVAELTREQIQNIHEAAGNPQRLLDQASEMSKHIANVAPATTAALAATHAQAAAYLSSVAPKTTTDTPFGPQPVPVPRGEMLAFAQKVDLVKHPENILLHVANGTLTAANVKAVQATSPAKLERMQMRLMTKMMGMSPHQRAAIPHQKQIAISAFLGVPIDGAFRPQNMKATTGLYASLNKPSAAPKASGAMMKFPQQAMTRQQKLRSGP